MKRYVTLGAALCLAAGVAGCKGEDPAPPSPAIPAAVTFDVTDEAGYWFDTGAKVAETRSLAIVKPGDKVAFLQTKSIHGPNGANGPSRVESLHTVTSLIWPAGTTAEERIDQAAANKDDHEVTLKIPGLYVFVCKVHPYMLAGVIVDDPTTTNPGSTPPGKAALDIGEKLHLLGVTHTIGVKDAANDNAAFSSNSNLALRLVRAFFVVTSPKNWKDYTQITTPPSKYKPTYPPVAVKINPVGLLPVPNGIVGDLNVALQGTFDGEDILAQSAPTTPGIGEVWVDTQYEISASKGAAYPSTITVVDAADWKVKRKIALPAQKMNNGHNMWASHDQNHIYQTEWHGKSLYVLDRANRAFLQEVEVGEDPAHVMTRVDTQQVHTGLNGADSVVELDRDSTTGLLTKKRNISMQDLAKPGNPTQPHAHWMGHDGKTMATPNANTNDSSFFDFPADKVVKKESTGFLPIAAAMNPDSTKTYVSNYLGHSISVLCGGTAATPPIAECVSGGPGTKIKDIPLLDPSPNGNYDVINGPKQGAPIGGLPIQTPVSPDGKFVVTGNTLTATITIIRTSDDTLVAMVPCDPGCHGVNFGAKKGGGYYAYVTSKFSNRLIVLDYDADNDGVVTQTGPDAPVIAGWVVLADDAAPTDDTITGNRGMGGQGVLPVPNVYNGWVQKLPEEFKTQLTAAQQNPVP
ncbi:MAG: copper oxidase [Nitrospira sp. CG24B]|nr:MAG: copper oxidase [Nitrospira sp. CG24B]